MSESCVGIVAEVRRCSDVLFIVQLPRVVYLFTSLTDIGCYDLDLCYLLSSYIRYNSLFYDSLLMLTVDLT